MVVLPPVASAQELRGFEPAQIERHIETAPAPVTRPPRTRLPEGAGTQVELSEQTFTLAGVLIEGVSVYANLEFLPLYQSYLGREITVATLREIAEAITRRYHADGYFLSNALLPAQDIEFGVVRIRVVEGYIDSWRFIDDAAREDVLVGRILQPVLAQRPVRRTDLVTALRTINELPDLTVNPEIRSLTGRPGAYRLMLAAERKRVSGSLSLDNRGSEFIGPVRVIAELGAFGLAGRHESWFLRLATAAETEELAYVNASTEWPLAANGLRLQLGTTQIRSQSGGELEELDVCVTNSRYWIGLLHPLLRESNRLRTISGYVGGYRSRTDVLGERRLEDRLMTVNLEYRGVRASGVDRVYALTLSITQGLAAGGSRIVDTQRGQGVGEPEFTSVDFNASHRQGLNRYWEISAALAGQYASRVLPASERYSIGGAQVGRAYDPSEITGDHGIAGRIEITRRNIRLRNAVWLSPYGFYDLGAVWRIRGGQHFNERASAASAGFGLRAVGSKLSATLELAQPLTRVVASEDSDRKRPRIFASLMYWLQ